METYASVGMKHREPTVALIAAPVDHHTVATDVEGVNTNLLLPLGARYYRTRIMDLVFVRKRASKYGLTCLCAPDVNDSRRESSAPSYQPVCSRHDAASLVDLSSAKDVNHRQRSLNDLQRRAATRHRTAFYSKFPLDSLWTRGAFWPSSNSKWHRMGVIFNAVVTPLHVAPPLYIVWKA